MTFTDGQSRQPSKSRKEEGQPPRQESGREGSLYPGEDIQEFPLQQVPGLAVLGLKPPPVSYLSMFHPTPSLSPCSLYTHTPSLMAPSQCLSPSSPFSSSYCQQRFLCQMPSEAKQIKTLEFGAKKDLLQGRARRWVPHALKSPESPEGSRQSIFKSCLSQGGQGM